MSRPQSEAEYLAQLVPDSVRAQRAALAQRDVSRRSLLRGAAGASALVGVPALLTACGGGSSSGGGGTGAASGTVTLGSNQSDAVPKSAVQAEIDAFKKANSGLDVKINTIDHNTFQENINNYLQGTPDDVFAWFAGYRMRYFASKGLVGDVSDIWGSMQGLSDAMKKASTGDDGKQYLVPSTYYPWAMFYRKSLFSAKGYEVPKTMDELRTLAAKMKKDGIDPIAFGDKDGWPAMGTFDQLNMRLNGYDYHVSLMAGKEDWAGEKVKKVFAEWKGLLEISQADSLGRTWQEAAKSLQQKKAGMYLLGSFVAQQFEKGTEQDDLDFFAFPEMDSTIGMDAVEAPIDGWMLAKRPKNEAGARKLLKFMGEKEGQTAVVTTDPSTVAANSLVSTAGYTALQKKSVEFVGKAKSISQFMDRDTRPDFASTVMIPALQSFIKNPNDVDSIVKSIADQKKQIFGS